MHLSIQLGERQGIEEEGLANEAPSEQSDAQTLYPKKGDDILIMTQHQHETVNTVLENLNIAYSEKDYFGFKLGLDIYSDIGEEFSRKDISSALQYLVDIGDVLEIEQTNEKGDVWMYYALTPPHNQDYENSQDDSPEESSGSGRGKTDEGTPNEAPSQQADALPLTEPEKRAIAFIEKVMLDDNTTLTAQMIRDYLANHDINLDLGFCELALRCMWYINKIGDFRMSISHRITIGKEDSNYWYRLETEDSYQQGQDFRSGRSYGTSQDDSQESSE